MASHDQLSDSGSSTQAGKEPFHERHLDPDPTTLPPTTPPQSQADPDIFLRIHPDGESGSRWPTLPGYEVLEELGRGGMGVVYRARQKGTNRAVALKVVLTGGHAGVAERARFQAEAEAVARLTHPGIVQVYEVGEYEGVPYFSMEYVEGGTLAGRLQGGSLRPAEAAQLVESLATAVHAAHQRGIIHRDLKPANVLLTEDGIPKVADFGLAKRLDAPGGQTATGAVLGTPSYMAPEQAAGQSSVITTLVDVYSLGAILYETLTGRPPFRAETPLATIHQVLECEPEPPRACHPEIDRDLEAACLKCLDKDPARRYGSAQALADDLRAWQAGEPVSARPPGLSRLVRRWLRRNLGAAAWTVLIGLCTGGATGALFWLVLGQPQIVRWLEATSEFFPNQPTAWYFVPTRWVAPDWLVMGLSWSSLFLFGAFGLLIRLLARPKTRAAEVVAGLTAGVCAAMTFAAMAMPPVLMVITSSAIWRDRHLTTDPARADPERTPVAVPRPEDPSEKLRDLPTGKREEIIHAKIMADLARKLVPGVWTMLFWPVALFVPMAIVETVGASVLWRRHGRLWTVIVPYGEMAFACGVWSACVGFGVPSLMIDTSPSRELWLLLGVSTVALTAILRGWPWWQRLAIWGLGLGLFAMQLVPIRRG